MKKIFYLLLVIGVVAFVSCKPPVGDYTLPATPACDNTTNPLSVGLIWAGTTYDCTGGPFAGVAYPPDATQYNYKNFASATGVIGSLGTLNSYLCTIVVKNDQTAENPTSPCSNPGMGSFTWSAPGATQTVYGFKNHNTDVTIDYYDICGVCDKVSGGQARPHFTGVSTVPTGATQAAVQLFNQPDYKSTNCQ